MSQKLKLLLLLILTICLYGIASSFNFFIWDDSNLALDSRFENFNFSLFTDLFTSSHYGLYHPITSLSLLLDYQLSNGSPYLFHTTNILLHLINIFLVYKFLSLLFKNKNIVFIASFIFAIHSSNVETVVWISSRKDLLYTFFYLCASIYYIKYLYKKRTSLYLLSLIFFLLSILSKVQAVHFVLITFLIELFISKNISKKNFILRIPFIVLSALFIYINYFIQNTDIVKESIQNSFFEKIIYSGYSIFSYIKHLILPYKLSIFYPYPIFNVKIIIISIITYTSILFTLYYLFKKKIYSLFFGLAFFTINLLIILNFYTIGESYINDRYFYIPSIGGGIIIAFFIEKLKFNNPIYQKITYTVLTTILIILTFYRILLWKDNVKLLENDYKTHPSSEIIGNSLSAILIDNKNYDSALILLNSIIIKHPNYWSATYNRGLVYYKLKKYDLAIKDFKSTLKINNYYEYAMLYLAMSYEKNRDYSNAANYFSIYFTFNSHPNLNTLKRAAFSFSANNQYKKSIALYKKAIPLSPNDATLYYNIADCYARINEFEKTLLFLDKAIKINPNFVEAIHFKGVIKFKLKQNGCAELNLAAKKGYDLSKKALLFYCQ